MLQWRVLLYFSFFHVPMAWSTLLILVPCSIGVVFFTSACSMLQWRGHLYLFFFHAPRARTRSVDFVSVAVVGILWGGGGGGRAHGDCREVQLKGTSLISNNTSQASFCTNCPLIQSIPDMSYCPQNLFFIESLPYLYDFLFSLKISTLTNRPCAHIPLIWLFNVSLFECSEEYYGFSKIWFLLTIPFIQDGI